MERISLVFAGDIQELKKAEKRNVSFFISIFHNI